MNNIVKLFQRKTDRLNIIKKLTTYEKGFTEHVINYCGGWCSPSFG